MVTLFFLFFSIESAFSPGTFSDKTFVRTTGLFLLLLLLSTVLGIFHTVMRTTTLDVSQWLICTAVALSIVVPPRSAKQCCDRPLPVPDGAQVLRRQRTVPRPSLRRQHRALTGPRPLDNGSCFAFPAAGRSRWPGAASCRFSWTRA